MIEITCINPPDNSGDIHPKEYSGSGNPVNSSITSSTALKQEPPARTSHVPFCVLLGQCPSQ